MCGVIGIISTDQYSSSNRVGHWVYKGLLNLQHRGQDAAGIATLEQRSAKEQENGSEYSFHCKKNLGTVSNVFETKDFESFKGSMALGHTRYATVGGNSSRDIQPLWGDSSLESTMIHNGNIVNYHRLKADLEENQKTVFKSASDCEVILVLFEYFCRELYGDERKLRTLSESEFSRVAQKVMEKLIGAYALLGMVAGLGLFALRDPWGIRPLVIGKRQRGEQIEFCFTSETIVLEGLGFEVLRVVAPSEFVFCDFKGQLHSFFLDKSVHFPETHCSKPTPCMFEWVYFSRTESQLEGQSVYSVRWNLGRLLAQKVKEKIKDSIDLVAPVPDTSRTAAISVAECLGLPYREVLIKNRYSQRSFILKSQNERELAVKNKLYPIEEEIRGKNILLVDDSIVRGTTSKRINQMLRERGAMKIYFAVSSPPIKEGCFYGIDFPGPEQLIAHQKDISEISKSLSADETIYLKEEDLKIAIGLNSLCMACVNGEYPTLMVDAEDFKKMRRCE